MARVQFGVSLEFFRCNIVQLLRHCDIRKTYIEKSIRTATVNIRKILKCIISFFIKESYCVFVIILCQKVESRNRIPAAQNFELPGSYINIMRY